MPAAALPLAGVAAGWLAVTVVVAGSGGGTARIQVVLAVVGGGGLLAGVRWRWAAATTAGVLGLVAAYALGLALRDTVDEGAPLVAAALVTVVLCSSWASEPPSIAAPAGEDPRRTRALAVLAATIGAAALAELVLVASSAATTRSLWLQVAGAAAALGAVGALLVLSRRSGPPVGPVSDPLRRRRTP